MERLLSIPVLVFLPMILSFLIMSPLFTGNEILIRRFTKGFCGLHFLYALLMFMFYNPANPYTSTLNIFGINWIQSLGVSFSFKIDWISLLLVVLTSFIFLMASVSSKINIRKNHKFYYSMLLLLMSAILGIFTANDMFVFFMFWELELIPAYFLIGGDFTAEKNPEAKQSAVKYVLFTFFGSMFMLLGILLLHYFNYFETGILSASYGDIFVTSIPAVIQCIIAVLLIIGFGVKLPIIPLHTWLPDAHTNAPTPVSMVLAGVLLKTGAYGIYRFNYEILKDAFVIIAPVLAVFALINIIFTAFVAYAQKDIKRIVAYSSISNMGLILLGICSMTKIGLAASVFHMVAHGIVTAGLFMICGIVYLRYKTRDIDILGGIAKDMPRLFGFATVIILASVGVPLFAPFIGEILTVTGALYSDIDIIIKVSALLALPLLILSSCYMLKFLHSGFYGEKFSSAVPQDIGMHEFLVLASILTGLVIFGIFPDIILSLAG